MSKNKTTENAVFTLHGYIKTRIAKLMGFQCKLEDVSWKIMRSSAWLKTQITFDDLRTFLVGSKTDDDLCGKRWMYLIDQIRDHKDLEPCASLPEENWEPEYRKWFDKLVELEVDKDMSWFEMTYHRTGRIQYSWNRDDMSEEMIAKLPEWWFDGTRAKRKLREINEFYKRMHE